MNQRETLPTPAELFGRPPIVDVGLWQLLVGTKAEPSGPKSPFRTQIGDSSFAILAFRPEWLRMGFEILWTSVLVGAAGLISWAWLGALWAQGSLPHVLLVALILITLVSFGIRSFARHELLLGRHYLALRRYGLLGPRDRVFDLRLVRRLRRDPFFDGKFAFDFGPDTIRFKTRLTKKDAAQFLTEARQGYEALLTRPESTEPAWTTDESAIVKPSSPRHTSELLDEDRLRITLPSQASLPRWGLLLFLFAATGLTILVVGFHNVLFALFALLLFLLVTLEIGWLLWGTEEIEVSTIALEHRAELLDFVRRRRLLLSEIKSISCGFKELPRGFFKIDFHQPLFGKPGGTLECWMGDHGEKMLVFLEEGETQLIVEEIQHWLAERGAWPLRAEKPAPAP